MKNETFKLVKNFTYQKFTPQFKNELLKQFKRVEYKGVNNITKLPYEEIYYCFEEKFDLKKRNIKKLKQNNERINNFSRNCSNCNRC